MTSPAKKNWQEGFLAKDTGSYIGYWSSIITMPSVVDQDITNPAKKRGGWPYIGDLFILAEEILQESK